MTCHTEQEKAKDVYTPPKILATYDRQALEESVQPHGQTPPGGGGCACGCGCGCSG